MARWLVALSGALAVVAALATAHAPRASAADSTTLLGPIGRGGDVATGGGKVFIAADNRIIVADRRGVLTGEIANLSGAVGLAMTADGTKIYAALRDSHQVAEIDATTLAVTRRIDLTAYQCPSNLALSGRMLWVGHGCGGWNGGVVGLDVSAASPEPVLIRNAMTGAPMVAVAGNTLVIGEVDISPADLFVYDVSASPATFRGEIKSGASYLRDLAIMPDGSMVVTAFEAPYIFDAWDTASLAKVRTFGVGPTIEGHPASVAISPDGAHVAGALGPARFAQTGPDITMYDMATTSKTYSNDSSIGNVAPGSLAFLGADLFAVLTGYNGTHLWRSHGALLSTSALSVTTPAATALEPLALTGRLTLTNGAAPGVQSLAVTRRLPDGTSTALPDTTTAVDGTFTITDTPPVSGAIKYDVLWDGNSDFRWSATSVTLNVAKHPASLTLSGSTTGLAGKKLQLSGTLDASGRAIPPTTKLTVQRTVTDSDGVVTTTVLSPVTPASDGSYSFEDTPARRGQHTYTVKLNDNTFVPVQASHDVTVRGIPG